MLMIDFYLDVYETELIQGDIKKAYNALVKIKHNAEKNLYKNPYYEAAYKFVNIVINVLEAKITVEQAKSQILELAQKIPEFFQYGKIQTGTSIATATGYIHRLEYAINRYDVRYPYFNMQRCDDL